MITTIKEEDAEFIVRQKMILYPKVNAGAFHRFL